MRKFISPLLVLCLLYLSTSQAQSRPKLVVGIVVDQMRYDFLYRYESKYGKGGFKRLMNEGFHCKNNHFNYVPTYTGPGHSSIYTGSVPAIHGIIANDWYDRKKDAYVYCAEDNSVRSIGTENNAGKMSPRNMLTTTICDQLKLHYNFSNKTLGIALKDRGAILPAGHTANAAYWFDSKTGNWISSSFYIDSLPVWVQQFNAKKIAEKYAAQKWQTLYSIDKYKESTPDDNSWEEVMRGETGPTFPHDLKKDISAIRFSPFGNNLTKDFMLAAIKGENMGTDSITDFLALSFSSTDYVGHAYGPNSIETEDTYLRLDKDLEEILNFLDREVGKNQYLVFLTADHGVAEVPGFAQSKKIPGRLLDFKALDTSIKQVLSKAYGNEQWILSNDNDQIFLNKPLFKEKNIDIKKAIELLIEALLEQPGIQYAINLTNLDRAALPGIYKERIINGYHQKRSGEIQYITEPGWITHGAKGTTHGSSWNYDTHVPLLFYGMHVKKGETSEKTSISDIAPTIANYLNILAPNGSIGHVIKISK
jgi:predicted AlkP superfamily pyrophosphatase or phosphodiesterase